MSHNKQFIDGKWQEVIPLKYTPNLLEKIVCFLGFHSMLRVPELVFTIMYCYKCDYPFN